jgi:hypothetical protein
MVLRCSQPLTNKNKSSKIVVFGANMVTSEPLPTHPPRFLPTSPLIRSAKKFQKVTLIRLSHFSPPQIRTFDLGWGGLFVFYSIRVSNLFSPNPQSPIKNHQYLIRSIVPRNDSLISQSSIPNRQLAMSSFPPAVDIPSAPMYNIARLCPGSLPGRSFVLCNTPGH